MKKQEFINKMVELYEKAEYNVKNADKLTLWIVIGLLSLALMFKSTNESSNIVVNVSAIQPTQIAPANKSVKSDLSLAEEPIVKTNDVSVISPSKEGVIYKKNVNDLNEIKPNGKFKYCFISYDVGDDNPFAKKEEPRVTFVLEEAMNPMGKNYVKTTIYSDSEEYISIDPESWFSFAEKTYCTDDMIKNNTVKARKDRFFK